MGDANSVFVSGRETTVRENPAAVNAETVPFTHLRWRTLPPSSKSLSGLKLDTEMDHYSLSARLLHWLMAVGFLVMWISGFAMTSVVADDSALQEFLFGFHISLGVTMAMLLAMRIVVRVTTPAPPPLAALSTWEKTGSHLGHLALYALPVAVLFLGWAEVDLGGHGVKWFGLPMPKIFPTAEILWGFNIETTSENLHRWLAYTLLAVVVLHIAAVVKHRLEGHDVLGRMMFK
ncbi:cytochrome b [Rhodobacteraceae bacterium M382]|nr:cytochrome b [Rhodobacteraceae bacterium M382]